MKLEPDILSNTNPSISVGIKGAPRACYANTYRTERVYGGPEEGGWFYESGEPISSTRFDSEADAARHARSIEQRPARLFSNRAESGVRVRLQSAPACAYPANPPRYDRD